MERKPLEVGKLYKRRDGKKCVCIWIDSDGMPITATLNSGDLDGELVFAGKPCGEVFGFGVEEDHRDIIGEWVEPRKPLEVWVSVFSNDNFGSAYSHEEKTRITSGDITGILRLFREVLE